MRPGPAVLQSWIVTSYRSIAKGGGFHTFPSWRDRCFLGGTAGQGVRTRAPPSDGAKESRDIPVDSKSRTQEGLDPLDSGWAVKGSTACAMHASKQWNTLIADFFGPG
uniref:Uncharacterized protein n=1 Tax=Steinernema glaseri TaxID=37863 RepID=A0A1I7YNT4_9BILA